MKPASDVCGKTSAFAIALWREARERVTETGESARKLIVLSSALVCPLYFNNNNDNSAAAAADNNNNNKQRASEVGKPEEGKGEKRAL